MYRRLGRRVVGVVVHVESGPEAGVEAEGFLLVMVELEAEVWRHAFRWGRGWICLLIVAKSSLFLLEGSYLVNIGACESGRVLAYLPNRG